MVDSESAAKGKSCWILDFVLCDPVAYTTRHIDVCWPPNIFILQECALYCDAALSSMVALMMCLRYVVLIPGYDSDRESSSINDAFPNVKYSSFKFNKHVLIRFAVA